MFFQSPFGEELRQSWPVGQAATIFIGSNPNNIGQPMYAWNPEPYDFSIVNQLHLSFAYDPTRKFYSTIDINVAGATPGATLANEVVAVLNANVTFATYFNAFVMNAKLGPVQAGPPFTVCFRPNNAKQSIKYYIGNDDAETQLQFNKKAPVKELPSYFVRHTVENRFAFPDSLACLIELDPLDPVDAAIITAAGLDPLNPLTDWEILHGRSINHLFRKITYDGSSRITDIVEYPAGAVVGDMAKLYQYTYTAANTTPDQITEIPHTLISSDLVTPP